jgi:hypothetical protein
MVIKMIRSTRLDEMREKTSNRKEYILELEK